MSIEEIISKNFEMSLEDVKKNSKRIDEINATYYWQPFRGGYAIIVNDNGEYLGASSSISFERHLEEFKKGEKNKNIFKE